MTGLDELQAAVATVTDRIGTATVAIGRDRRGAGVVIADGQVLTNAHNLRDRTTQITFADGRTAQAEVLGADPDGDLVVLAVDTSGATAAEWSTDAAVAAGQIVFAAARGRQGLRVTFGVVSGVDREFRGPRGRRIGGGVEHTAPLARGSSGGPLADAEGRLLGLNTHRLGDGFYLAVAADATLRERVDQLAAGTSPSHRRLGVTIAPAHVARRLRRAVGLPERDGLLVRGVEDGSPAAAAGVAMGDLIVTADGRDVGSADDLWAVLDGLGNADAVDLGVVRGAEELTVRVTFEAGAAATEEGSA
jgi:S1-C subfamily serine protease